MAEESYPPGWVHATLHVNPATGEVHRDGNQEVLSILEWALWMADNCASLGPKPALDAGRGDAG